MWRTCITRRVLCLPRLLGLIKLGTLFGCPVLADTEFGL